MQSDVSDSDFFLVRILIDNYRLIDILSQKLKIEINSEITHELCYLIKSLLNFSSRIQMEEIILESGFICAILESIIGSYGFLKV